MSGKKSRHAQKEWHPGRRTRVAGAHVNEGERCGVKKWCPVILNSVKDLGRKTVGSNRFFAVAQNGKKMLRMTRRCSE